MTMPAPRPADYAAARAIGLRVGVIGLPLAAVNALADTIKAHDQASLGQFGPAPRVDDVAITAIVGAWPILLCLAGLLAGRRTGFIEAGVVTGFIASLLDCVVYLIFRLIWDLLYPVSLIWIKPEAYPRYPLRFSILDVVLIIGGAALLAGACCGFLGGAIGALLHRRQLSRAG